MKNWIFYLLALLLVVVIIVDVIRINSMKQSVSEIKVFVERTYDSDKVELINYITIELVKIDSKLDSLKECSGYDIEDIQMSINSLQKQVEYNSMMSKEWGEDIFWCNQEIWKLKE